jgi:hypothetical protein
MAEFNPILSQISQPKEQKAWVVFSGDADLPWLKILKKGYRHCYVLLNDGEHWISLDPLSCHTEIMVHHIAPEFDLSGWLALRDLTVIPAEIKPKTSQAPIGFYSCVEAVKHVLGLHNPWIITPWQLYKKLRKGH